MGEGLYAEAQKFQANFYEKLVKDNSEAVGKLYSSSGNNAEFPEFPPHLQGVAQDEIGWWTVGDPSVNSVKSFIVGKWKGMQGDLSKKFAFLNFLEKLVPIICTIFVAWLAKLGIDDPEKSEMVVLVVISSIRSSKY